MRKSTHGFSKLSTQNRIAYARTYTIFTAQKIGTQLPLAANKKAKNFKMSV